MRGGGKVGADLWIKKLIDLHLAICNWVPYLMKDRILEPRKTCWSVDAGLSASGRPEDKWTILNDSFEIRLHGTRIQSHVWSWSDRLFQIFKEMFSSNVLLTDRNDVVVTTIATFVHRMTTLKSKELTETYWSVENNKRAIVSDEFRLKQNYRKVHRF